MSSSIKVDEISPISGGGGVNFTGLFQPTFNGQPLIAGGQGATGISSATLFLYQRTSTLTPPALPTATVTYEFTTGIATGINGGWSRSLPSTGGQYRWLTTATAFSQGISDNILATEWATATLLSQDGVDGVVGSSTAVVYLYKRSSTVLTSSNVPSATVTYTFASSTATGLTNGWAQAIPAGSDPLYVIVASAVSTTASDTIGSSEWTAPVILVQNGTNGAAGTAGSAGASGTQTSIVYLYQWWPVSPADPSGTSIFTWSTAANSTYTGGNNWQTTVPANPGTSGIKLWAASKGISTTAGTATSSIDWTTGVTKSVLSQNGQDGGNGLPGIQSGKPTLFQWAPTIPSGPTGTSVYTWASASFNNVAALASQGWNLTPGTSPSPGFTLWSATVNLSDSSASPTTGINWSTAAVSAIGYAGTQGSAGIKGDTGLTGIQGASARLAYTKITGSGPLGNSPSNLSLSGDVTPTAATWGSTTWSVTVPTFSPGESIWQSDGIYNPATNQTIWGVPYLSSFKVGQLSAISANLGAITSGNITLDAFSFIKSAGASYGSGSGFFLGYSGSDYKFSVGSMTYDGIVLSVPAASISGQLAAGQINSSGLVLRDTAGNIVFGQGASINPSSYMNVPSSWLNSNQAWSDVSGKPGSDAQLVKNLVDPSTWVLNSSGSQPGFNQFATSSGGQNSIVMYSSPDGTLRPVWRASSGSGPNSADGGWTSSAGVQVLTKNTYRYSVWTQVVNSGTLNGTLFLGAQFCDVSPLGSATADTNPYFVATPRGNLTVGKWYLVVGYIFSAGTGLPAQHLGGVYDGTTGLKIIEGVDYQFRQTNTTDNVGLRTFHLYSNTTGSIQYFYDPRISLCDGTEPTLNQLLSVSVALGATVGATAGVDLKDSSGAALADSAIKNSAITVGADGVLTNVGTSGVVVDNKANNFGQNLITNSDITSSLTWYQDTYNPAGATFDANLTYASTVSGWDYTGYVLAGGTTRNAYLHQSNKTSGGDDQVAVDIYPTGGTSLEYGIPVVAGRNYCLSAYLQGHRCKGGAYINWLNSLGASVGVTSSSPNDLPYGAANVLTSYRRVYTLGTAPAGAVVGVPYLRKFNTLVQGTESYFWIAAPQFEQIGDKSIGPSPYSPGPSNRVSQLGYSGDLNATSDLVLINTSGCSISGNTVTKTDINGAWNAGVASQESFTGGAYVSFSVGGLCDFALGLNTDPLTNSSFDTLDYCFLGSIGGSLFAYEGGVSKQGFGAYVATDILSIIYDGSLVRHLINGVVVREVAAGANLRLFLDSSLHTPGMKVRSIKFGPYGNPSAIQPNNPITPTNSGVFISNLAVKSAMIEELRTANYAEANGVTTAGAKLASQGTALTVASGSFKVGSLVFTDYWFRLLSAIDGNSTSAIIWRGNIDSTIRGGSPNIACLSLSLASASQVVEADSASFWFRYILQPTAYSDNLDSMRFGDVWMYPRPLGSNGGKPVAVTTFNISDRLYRFADHSNSANASKGQFVVTYKPGYGVQTGSGGTGITAASTYPNLFNGVLRIVIYNAYGASADRWYYGAGLAGVGYATDSIMTPSDSVPTDIANSAAAPTPIPPSGGGESGGYCPAPWVKIAMLNGTYLEAASLYEGAKVVSVDDHTLLDVKSGGTIRYIQTAWANRLRLKLTNGKVTEWSEDHRFYVMNKGWTALKDIRLGDLLAGPEENVVESIIATGQGQVISFTVEGSGTYFGDGILSHNRKLIANP
jgi:hypothetical protein